MVTSAQELEATTVKGNPISKIKKLKTTTTKAAATFHSMTVPA